MSEKPKTETDFYNLGVSGNPFWFEALKGIMEKYPGAKVEFYSVEIDENGKRKEEWRGPCSEPFAFVNPNVIIRNRITVTAHHYINQNTVDENNNPLQDVIEVRSEHYTLPPVPTHGAIYNQEHKLYLQHLKDQKEPQKTEDTYTVSIVEGEPSPEDEYTVEVVNGSITVNSITVEEGARLELMDKPKKTHVTDEHGKTYPYGIEYPHGYQSYEETDDHFKSEGKGARGGENKSTPILHLFDIDLSKQKVFNYSGYEGFSCARKRLGKLRHMEAIRFIPPAMSNCSELKIFKQSLHAVNYDILHIIPETDNYLSVYKALCGLFSTEEDILRLGYECRGGLDINTYVKNPHISYSSGSIPCVPSDTNFKHFKLHYIRVELHFDGRHTAFFGFGLGSVEDEMKSVTLSSIKYYEYLSTRLRNFRSTCVDCTRMDLELAGNMKEKRLLTYSKCPMNWFDSIKEELHKHKGFLPTVRFERELQGETSTHCVQIHNPPCLEFLKKRQLNGYETNIEYHGDLPVITVTLRFSNEANITQSITERHIEYAIARQEYYHYVNTDETVEIGKTPTSKVLRINDWYLSFLQYFQKYIQDGYSKAGKRISCITEHLPDITLVHVTRDDTANTEEPTISYKGTIPELKANQIASTVMCSTSIGCNGYKAITTTIYISPSEDIEGYSRHYDVYGESCKEYKSFLEMYHAALAFRNDPVRNMTHKKVR